MLKKTITYEDYNGVERTEDFYFHLNKSDLVIWTAETMGAGLEVYFKSVLARGNHSEILAVFQRLIQMSIGVKSPDGREFIKNDEVREAFINTNAYQDLFMELMEDSAAAAEFVNGIMPTGSRKNVNARNEPREYSHDELLSMDENQFLAIAGDPKHMSREHLMVAFERKTRI
jgi:hypothetical protein